MHAKDFVNQLDRDQIVAAIHDAERRTSGEIRVFISRKPVEDPVATAQAAFLHLGMEKTREHNGVLIFVAPRTHQFAVIGDSAVHSKCGDGFWQELAKAMTGHFGKSEFTQGLILGVKRAGEILAQHFPRRHKEANELSDDIAHD